MDPFANEEPTITASAAFVESPSNNKPTPQERQFQAAAYETLVQDGGRPSHPLGLLERIVFSPGRYRGILAFWQDRSDEWQVFHKQLSRWQAFRTHQRASRNPDRFNEYILDLRERLDRHGFELPNGHRTPPHGLRLEIEKQSKVATWLEYINYEFSRRDEDEKWLETHRPSYDAALAQLIDAQVLKQFEQVRTPTSDICRPSSLEVARRKEERQKAEEECEAAKKRMGDFDSLEQTQTPQEMEKHEREYEEAMLRCKAINDRDLAISEFGRKTHAYRFAMDRSERHELLLRWATSQIPLIEEEIRQMERRDAALRERSSYWRPKQQAKTFPQFQRLPPEIRHRIWEEMLPKSPSVHFFNVLNCESQRHLVPSWSSEEFRLRATKRRDSAYLSVYRLLATCRESRSIVERYYILRRRGVSCPLSGGPINFSDRPPDFRTFDWIPCSDLLVLCFPPVQVAQLPSANAFTLDPGPNQAARRLGVMIPKGLMSMPHFDPMDDGDTDDDAAQQLALVPEFINHLHGSIPGPQTNDATPRGIWKLYLMVEGWSTNHIQMQLRAKIDSKEPVGDWADGPIYWRAPSAKRGGRMLPWGSISEPPPGPEFPLGAIINIMQNDPVFFNTNFNHNQRIIHQPAPEGDGARQLYWLGSRRPALGTLRPDDFVQKRSAQKLHDFMQILEVQCRVQQWHHNFGGVEALGWLEPASKRSLDVAEVRELERITKQTGKWPRAFQRMKRERWDDEDDF
ncbi:hypothetical protein CCMA1212_001150 [Trichoderma ghanense]|uniref:2EXR domain-containing protein n=1 Tax=Trichoderma ghanense TaxID=65468 RepID=A0ABY2HGX6_9HYPO